MKKLNPLIPESVGMKAFEFLRVAFSAGKMFLNDVGKGWHSLDLW
jgi:hypothetical protein